MFNNKFVVVATNYVFPKGEYDGYFTLNIDKYHPLIHKEILLKMIDEDIPTVIQTNHFATQDHINNLILLSKLNVEASISNGYEGKSINVDDISAFEYKTEERTLYPLVLEGYGYRYDWLTEHINDTCNIVTNIQREIDELTK